MSGLSASETTTAEPGKAVREALADLEVIRGLRAIIRLSLGRTGHGGGRQIEADVDDCFSEVCSRGLSTAAIYDPSRGSVLNWLSGIAMKILRERRKLHPITLDTQDLERPDGSQAIPDLVSDRLEIEGLLSKLSPDEQQLLRWDYDGWSASEIGAELNLAVTAVRVRVHRLRKKAKQLLGRASTGGADHD